MNKKQPKIFFADNLKFLRKRKKISQEALAEILEMTRAKLAALEAGLTKAPQPEDFIKFSQYYKISIDSLLQIDLAKLGAFKLKELEAGNDVYMTGSKVRVLAITVNKDNNENMEYVPVKAKAGYADGYADPEFISSLPKFSLPNLPKGKTFRMFPTKGDSMLPIPEGSDIIGEYVQNWQELKPQTPCIVILKNAQDFVFKMVTVQQDGQLLLASMNKSFAPYTVEASDVLEIWQFYRYQTGTLPEPPTDLDEVKRMIESMEGYMRKLP